MTKKNKNFTSVPSKKFPITVPEVNNMDDIGYFSDEFLYEKINKLETERLQLLELKLEPTPWEVELAYLRREQQIRKTRSEKHEVYSKEFSNKGEDQFFDASPRNINNSIQILN